MPRVLVVDDEVNIVRLIQVNLERQGYQVETANNGAQALAKIRESRPDLLVSDVMMPEMDGFELLANVRRDPVLNDLPVIMLTAKAQVTRIASSRNRRPLLRFRPTDAGRHAWLEAESADWRS